MPRKVFLYTSFFYLKAFCPSHFCLIRKIENINHNLIPAWGAEGKPWRIRWAVAVFLLLVSFWYFGICGSIHNYLHRYQSCCRLSPQETSKCLSMTSGAVYQKTKRISQLTSLQTSHSRLNKGRRHCVRGSSLGSSRHLGNIISTFPGCSACPDAN